MKTRFYALALALALMLVTGLVAYGQGPITLTVTQVDTSQFPKIEVYVSATDAAGNPVRNLLPSAFQLQENGQAMQLTAATRAGEQGFVNTVLVIDRSGSMRLAGKMDGAKQAATAFVELMRPGDRTALIQFDTAIDVLQPLTEDTAALRASIQKIVPRGNTAMYDALAQADTLLQPVTGRKAVILLTDGMDNASKLGRDAILKQAGASGLSIYTMGVGNKATGKGGDDGVDEGVLQALASASNGTYAYTPDATHLRELYQQLSARIQNEYKLTYLSPNALHDGVPRNIVVTAPSAADTRVTYNPGGVIPEAASQTALASWVFFALALAALLALLFTPAILARTRGQPSKPKSRVKLTDNPVAAKSAAPKLKVNAEVPARAPQVQVGKKSPAPDVSHRPLPWDEERNKH
ncbi:MAG: VWA domain-containing protein [Chloroflexi bacterium]|nr:VWA domain-containing protein [Chloroflexota bacterium]